jgi:hypothetical protein
MCKKTEPVAISWEEVIVGPFVPDENFDSAKFAEDIKQDAVKNGEEN